jgi:hypothetical protein
MKSIKEKANEYAKDYLFSPLPQRAPNIHFEAGANYVLEKFVDIVNKNTKPNGIEDRAKMAYDMLILIAQLKK